MSRHYDHLGSSNNGEHRTATNIDISRANEMSSTNSSPISSSSGAGYIEHPVSKFDTLAGVAIKYGVEVAEIKKMNALVTDLQMFALQSLQIPTPGKHPPSPSISDDLEISRQSSSEHNTTRPMPLDVFDSFKSLRVKSSTPKATDLKFSFELSAFKKGESDRSEDEPMLASLPDSSAHRSRHRKTKSLVSNFLDENGEFSDISTDGVADFIKGNDKLVRRRQRSVADLSSATEKLDRSYGDFSSMRRKSLELRIKAAARSSISNGSEVGKLMTSILMVDEGDSNLANGKFSARKSSSTSNLQDPEKGNSSSIWSTSSLFDGMPKPTAKFKASMD